MVQFDFADVTGNSVLEHSIHFLQLLFIGVCYARDKFKKNDYFNKRKQETRMEKFVLLSPVLRRDQRRRFNILL